MNTSDYYLKLLGGNSNAALESTNNGLDLSAERIADSLGALERAITTVGTDAVDADRAKHLLANARSGMQRLSSEGPESALSDDEVKGLEAVILTDGSRPAVFVQDNSIPLRRSVLGTWHGDAQMHHERINSVTRSVGRINDPTATQKFSGTGFVVAPGVIATNRHVLEAVGAEHPGQAGTTSWTIHPDVEINFSHEFERDIEPGYTITRVLYAGPMPIRGEVNFERLDLALLQCETDDNFPPNIPLADPSSTIGADRKVYVIGYPARPLFEDRDVLADIFANTFGWKRWAPGKTKAGPGELEGDDEAWIMSHDASTLGGNSGSTVFLFEGAGDVCVGMHFAGVSRQQNYAHVVAKIREQLAMH